MIVDRKKEEKECDSEWRKSFNNFQWVHVVSRVLFHIYIYSYIAIFLEGGGGGVGHLYIYLIEF